MMPDIKTKLHPTESESSQLLDQVLQKLALTKEINDITLGVLSRGVKDSLTLTLRVSVPTSSGFKVVARFGKNVREIYVNTALTQMELKKLVSETLRFTHDPISQDIPIEEQWLWQNPTTLAIVQDGLKQAQVGHSQYLGDFTQYADLEIED
ncbi:DUF2103 domain-containing protein [Thermosynechococcaceae cyanobacterium BACA0444]|uniref:DUF2103 domain-containing protein n=2 Tax=Pseudocalidococcus TaxID=3110321 RepID=A0AAE4FND4_9CYAN|nr:DUF2103 domain-containing protein [Pseudocalidococcus azoricus BACA0444]